MEREGNEKSLIQISTEEFRGHEMDPKMWAYLYRDLANEMRRTQKRILRRVLVVTEDGSVESRWQLLPERRRIQSRASR